jgi:glutathione synthase/RimK-type ligase-like ATP-grasp enzyme
VASKLARAAAAASGLDLVGVDLLPTGPGGFCVIELNGAVDFRPAYSFPGRNVFADAIAALSGGRDTLGVGAVEAAS